MGSGSIKNGGSLLVGLSGGSCAGKSTLAQKVREKLIPVTSAILICDRYYRPLDHLPLEQRHHQNFDSPALIDLPLLEEHLRLLKSGLPVEIPVYDYHRHTRSKRTEAMNPPQVVLVEGILLFAEPRLLSLLDLKVYVDLDPDVRLARRIKRDRAERGRSVDSVIEQYFATVRPAHRELIEPTRGSADLIVGGEGDMEESAKCIADRVRSMLGI